MDITNDPNLPVPLRYPEYHLIPWTMVSIDFLLNNPEYVEDPKKTAWPDYLYIYKDGKFGILYWHQWVLFSGPHRRIIPCKFEKIEKVKAEFGLMFICYNGGKRYYYDTTGTLLPS